jgi:PAS domain S-box-containing protein
MVDPVPDFETRDSTRAAGPAANTRDFLFRLLVETVRDYAILLLEPTGRIVTWNPGAERLKGYAAQEIIGKHFSVFYPEDDARSGNCDRELEEAARVGRFEDEGWRLRKDGSRFWANVVITALRDEKGTLVGFAKITRDLTARREAEEQRVRLAQAEEASRLKDSFLVRERELRSAVEDARSSLATTLKSIGDGVIATDRAGNVTIMNPVAEALTGWKLEEVQGHPLQGCFHIVHQETRSLVESPVDRVLREGTVVGVGNHTVLVARDGTETPISDCGAPIRDESGDLRGVVLVFRDAGVATRDAARRDFLADATVALGSSLDSRETLARVAEIVVPRFADWCMVDVLEDDNDIPKCVGAAHVDPLKIDFVRDLGRRYRPRPDENHGIIRVLRTGRAEHYPVVTRAQVDAWAREDEQRRLLRELRMSSVAIVPLTAGPRVVGAMTLVYGDSGRRYTPEDIACVEELGRRAGTAIENARLYALEQRARDLADSASRMKDEFLATVSHELRTPLSAILGWVRMLASNGIGEEKRARAVQTIERNARAMTQLIEDLLDVSRIVSGKMRIERDHVDLAIVLHGALEGVRPAADAKQIRLEEQLSEGVGPVTGDAARLQQVFWNLLSNAVKFTPTGGRVTIRLARQGSHVEVGVRDTGIGVDPRFLPHVFEPFRQADATMKRTSGGLGLGLAIVKHLVEQHGGRVEAQSDGLDRGATFVVRLPIPAAQSRPPPKPAATQHPNEAMPRLDAVRVLVVEDDLDTREMLRQVLSGCGARVSLAASATQAMLAFTRGEAPDVLVSDLGMPEVTGFDLIEWVRGLPVESGGKVPAAALSAYVREADRRAVLAAGFDLHIPKPIDPNDLCATVARLSRLR